MHGSPVQDVLTYAPINHNALPASTRSVPLHPENEYKTLHHQQSEAAASLLYLRAHKKVAGGGGVDWYVLCCVVLLNREWGDPFPGLSQQ